LVFAHTEKEKYQTLPVQRLLVCADFFHFSHCAHRASVYSFIFGRIRATSVKIAELCDPIQRCLFVFNGCIGLVLVSKNNVECHQKPERVEIRIDFLLFKKAFDAVY
jgi:hypothetical protein